MSGIHCPTSSLVSEQGFLSWADIERDSQRNYFVRLTLWLPKQDWELIEEMERKAELVAEILAPPQEVGKLRHYWSEGGDESLDALSLQYHLEAQKKYPESRFDERYTPVQFRFTPEQWVTLEWTAGHAGHCETERWIGAHVIRFAASLRDQVRWLSETYLPKPKRTGSPFGRFVRALKTEFAAGAGEGDAGDEQNPKRARRAADLL